MDHNFNSYFQSDDPDLPIQLSSYGLFESRDRSSQFLFEKLQAWANYQGLVHNWFADESKLINLRILLTPESEFLSLKSQLKSDWAFFSEPGVTGIKQKIIKSNANIHTVTIDAYLALSNADIKEMMDTPSKVEFQLQTLLQNALNALTTDVQVAKV